MNPNIENIYARYKRPNKLSLMRARRRMRRRLKRKQGQQIKSGLVVTIQVDTLDA